MVCYLCSKLSTIPIFNNCTSYFQFQNRRFIKTSKHGGIELLKGCLKCVYGTYKFGNISNFITVLAIKVLLG